MAAGREIKGTIGFTARLRELKLYRVEIMVLSLFRLPRRVSRRLFLRSFPFVVFPSRVRRPSRDRYDNNDSATTAAAARAETFQIFERGSFTLVLRAANLNEACKVLLPSCASCGQYAHGLRGFYSCGYLQSVIFSFRRRKK